MTDRKKREYSKPTLAVYGSIREITNAVGNKGVAADGGMGSTDKTA